ncbi:3-oxoacyl-[acyl-carrier-protein] reductase [bacterium]|nr:3-oxoacyl-[acyl-carrier-protein] reductase [bacterium]
MDFSERISLITGASQGIGKAIALELAQAGSKVALLDVQKEKLEEVAQQIHSRKGQAFPYVVDITRSGDVTKIVESIIQEHQKIDHLVNNAGINRDNLLMRMKEKEWDDVLTVNLKGTFNCTKALIRKMMSQRYGRIVNISSVVGLMGNAGQSNYSASKAGIIGFSKSLAREAAPRGITVNVVAPGYISTDMTERLGEAIKKKFLDFIPMKRFGMPEEVAQVVKFLLSDEAAYITGQVISINGGMFM